MFVTKAEPYAVMTLLKDSPAQLYFEWTIGWLTMLAELFTRLVNNARHYDLLICALVNRIVGLRTIQKNIRAPALNSFTAIDVNRRQFEHNSSLPFS